MPPRRFIYPPVQVSDTPASSRTPVDERTYVCRLTIPNAAKPPGDVRVRAASYDDAIKKGISAFRSMPDFVPPAVRVTLHAYLVTSTGIDAEDAVFKFIRPEDWTEG